jgi:putative membrane protein
MGFLTRLVITAAALYAATRLVDGISYAGAPLGLLAVALVFGAVNGLVAPVLKFFSFPLVIVTLGLFLLVINGAMLLLTARLAASLGFAFTVRDFGSAFWGALVVSLVSMILQSLVGKGERHSASA